MVENSISYLRQILRKWSFRIVAMGAVLALAVCSTAAFAQSGASSIQGTVTDPTGAVIPGASIHVVNQATGVAVDTKSTNVGFYQVPGLFTGTYAVTITAPGMKTYTQTLELLVAQNAVVNAALTAGAVTQQVEVNANAVQLVTTTSGTIGSTLENARINQLPMNGRETLTLLSETTPGVSTCANSVVCVNGLQNSGTDIVADGVTLANRLLGGFRTGNVQIPDPDSTQEVKMETSGVGAEYATPSVGILTTKSGTNKLHGSFFETARNNAWGIAKSRQDPSNYSAPPLVRNEFGLSVGGPIVLPHVYHGKDKSFWFFSYERYSLATTSYILAPVPTMAMRSGDWSGLTNSAGVLQQLYDPNTTAANGTCPVPTGGTTNNAWCRQPFPVSASGAPNQIPISRLSPTTKVIYAITPQPSNSQNPLVEPNYNDPNPQYNVTPNITFRLDHEFNENNRAYLRFSYIPAYTSNLNTSTITDSVITLPATVGGVNYPYAASGLTTQPGTMYASALGYTHVFSPSFFSETVLSLQNFKNISAAAGSPNTNFETELGLPNNFGEPGFPEIDSQLAPLFGTMYRYGLAEDIPTIDENLTKTVGKHQMQFGGHYRFERFTFYSNQATDEITFTAGASALENPATNAGNTYTGYANTGYADADEFLGAGASYQVNHEPPNAAFRDMTIAGYFQDNYHAARNFTLNLGLRYEAYPAMLMNNGMFTGFDMKNDAIVFASTPAQLVAKGLTTQAIINNIGIDGGKIETAQEAGLPSTLLDNHDLNFLPRVGFAWQPFGKWGTVIRAAYGRYLSLTDTYYGQDNQALHLPYNAAYTQNYTSAAQSPDGLPDYIMRAPQTESGPLSAGTPVMGMNTSSAIINSGSDTAILPGIVETSVDPDFEPEVATQVNFTIEQPMKGNSALRVSWIYSRGSNIQQYSLFNEHPSNYVWEMQTGTTPPNGGAATIGTSQYAATATGPYDKLIWASGSHINQTSGWSNYNALQVVYQKLYHRGVAWQILYNFAKDMGTGFGQTTGEIYPAADYADSAVSTMTSPYGTVITPNLGPPEPAGMADWQWFKALNRFESYTEQTMFPRNELKFNGIVDLPIGRDKWLLGNSNRFMNELVGGWQIAGDGDIISQQFSPVATMYGPTSPLHVYKHKVPVTDCRSGTCLHASEWFNGYLAPTANANVDCTKNCLSGLPGSWAPYQTPIDNTPGTTYYGDEEVNITLANGKTSAIAYSPGPTGANPYSKTVLSGPMNWTADASLFKVIPLNEGMNLRFNMDAFNVFNIQGDENPGTTDGVEEYTTSHNAPRQIQFTLRFSF